VTVEIPVLTFSKGHTWRTRGWE